MGSLHKSSYSIPMPKGAIVSGEHVSWRGKNGEKKEGKLVKTKKGELTVLIETNYWIAKYTDENGKQKNVATKMTSREAAQKLLNSLENDVDRIRAKVVTREELDRTSAVSRPISDYIEQYRVKMVSKGNTVGYITQAQKRIEAIINDRKIKTLADLTQKNIEQWIADELERKETPPKPPQKKRKKGEPKLPTEKRVVKRTPGTINTYLATLGGFTTWCVENKHLTSDPLQKIKLLNAAVGRQKERRSFTEEELKMIFVAAESRRYIGRSKGEEHVLVYKLLVGTGLRSSELGTATVDQFDFDRCRFRVRAVATKNKKDDVLPIRPDLIAAMKEWVIRHEIKPGQRIFRYSKKSIHAALKSDLRAAGIKQKGADGRSVDVHSFRRTFGTMLARAGVPLTTTQRLMRHSTPELTAKLYIDVEPIDMATALDKLPGFGDTIPGKQKNPRTIKKGKPRSSTKSRPSNRPPTSFGNW